MSRNQEINPSNDGAEPTRQSNAERTRSVLSSFAARDLSSPPVGRSDAVTTGDATVSGPSAQTSDAYDPKVSPAELVKQGKFKDRTATRQESVLEIPDLNDKTPPKISVGMEDITKQPPDKPHFVVKQNGDIEMFGDPEALKAKDIKIQLERNEGQLYPTDAQKAAAEKLVTYLSDRLKSQNPDLAKNGVELADNDAVVSPEARQNAGMRQPQSSQMSPETQQSVGNMNRFKGNNGGEMPMGNTRDYFPNRDVPRQANESDQQAAVKEAAAGLFNPDKSEPYSTIRKSPEGDHRVGRYGFSGRQIHNWLAGLDLGDPPDPAKIEELIKQGKLPKGFNADSLKKLQAMAQKMANGEAPSKDDMKLLPKEMQETMATDMVGQLKERLGDNPGAIAAGMMSGKAPSELTQEDLNSPTGKQLADAGQRLYDIATARQQSTDDNDKIQWNQDGKVSIGNGKWLSGAAGQAFIAAQKDAAADGVTIRVNSAGRTLEEQKYLYANRGTKGISRTVALPGRSNHESGNALDIANYQQAKPYLQKYGFVHGDGNGPISNDLVHFKYTGRSNTRYA
ncbi:MAG: hypothetical protein C0508_00825 [Cyanobacteria bacterium PR.023]|jgi:LAS superfamily LD-carboxypeptidase LdcB|nr:hypothetical protein [Cyanobacteria bacterium PR.023]